MCIFCTWFSGVLYDCAAAIWTHAGRTGQSGTFDSEMYMFVHKHAYRSSLVACCSIGAWFSELLYDCVNSYLDAARPNKTKRNIRIRDVMLVYKHAYRSIVTSNCGRLPSNCATRNRVLTEHCATVEVDWLKIGKTFDACEVEFFGLPWGQGKNPTEAALSMRFL